MADYDYTNPFAAIATPESMYQQREADIQKRYDPAGFWVGEAARAGSAMRKALNAQGIAMGAADERAMNNKSMLEGLQRNLAEEVKAGAITPEEAQVEAVKRAMQGFMETGDYEQAASLKPALDAIMKQELERDKLRSEKYKNTQAGYKDEVDAARILARTGPEVDLLEAQADKERAAKSATKASLAAWEAGTGEEPDWSKMMTPGDRYKLNGTITGGARLFDRLGQVSTLIANTPGLGSSTAGTIAMISDEMVGAGNTAANLLSLQSEPDRQVSQTVEERNRQKVKEQAWATARASMPGADADSLNVARGRFESLMMDLAYTLAKARDPGGRLSDADVNNAMQILGAAGSPARMQAVLKDLAANTYKDIDTTIRGNAYARSSTELHDARQIFYKAYEDYNAGIEALLGGGQKSTGPTSRGRGGAAQETPGEEKVTMPDGKVYTIRSALGSP